MSCLIFTAIPRLQEDDQMQGDPFKSFDHQGIDCNSEIKQRFNVALKNKYKLAQFRYLVWPSNTSIVREL